MGSKLTSRKLWISIAAFLASLGTGITGLAINDHRLVTIGTICTVLSAAIYAAAEAYVDGKSAAASTTAEITAVKKEDPAVLEMGHDNE